MTAPFIAGQDAYRAGRPETDNPHPEGVIEGDGYPGPWANWRDGWRHAKALAEFSRAAAQPLPRTE